MASITPSTKASVHVVHPQQQASVAPPLQKTPSTQSINPAAFKGSANTQHVPQNILSSATHSTLEKHLASQKNTQIQQNASLIPMPGSLQKTIVQQYLSKITQTNQHCLSQLGLQSARHLNQIVVSGHATADEIALHQQLKQHISTSLQDIQSLPPSCRKALQNDPQTQQMLAMAFDLHVIKPGLLGGSALSDKIQQIMDAEAGEQDALLDEALTIDISAYSLVDLQAINQGTLFQIGGDKAIELAEKIGTQIDRLQIMPRDQQQYPGANFTQWAKDGECRIGVGDAAVTAYRLDDSQFKFYSDADYTIPLDMRPYLGDNANQNSYAYDKVMFPNVQMMAIADLVVHGRDALVQARTQSVITGIGLGAIFEPIVITPREQGGYTLQQGNHRLGALTQLGLSHVPVRIV